MTKATERPASHHFEPALKRNIATHTRTKSYQPKGTKHGIEKTAYNSSLPEYGFALFAVVPSIAE